MFNKKEKNNNNNEGKGENIITQMDDKGSGRGE